MIRDYLNGRQVCTTKRGFGEWSILLGLCLCSYISIYSLSYITRINYTIIIPVIKLSSKWIHYSIINFATWIPSSIRSVCNILQPVSCFEPNNPNLSILWMIDKVLKWLCRWDKWSPISWVTRYLKCASHIPSIYCVTYSITFWCPLNNHVP